MMAQPNELETQLANDFAKLVKAGHDPEQVALTALWHAALFPPRRGTCGLLRLEAIARGLVSKLRPGSRALKLRGIR
jgi:hypothetical protein